MSILEEMTATADTFVQANKWDDSAVKINAQILTIDSKNDTAYARLGRCFMEQEKWHSARQMFLTLLMFNQNDRLAKNSLHEILPHFEEDETDILDHIMEMSDYYELLALSLAYSARGESEPASCTMNRALQIGKPRHF